MANKFVRTVNDVKNPKWINAEHTRLNCEVDFDELDEVYVEFTADPNDIEEHGRKIFEDCVAEKYGTVAEFDSVTFEADRKAMEDAIAKHTADKANANQKLKDLGLTDDEIKAIKGIN